VVGKEYLRKKEKLSSVVRETKTNVCLFLTRFFDPILNCFFTDGQTKGRTGTHTDGQTEGWTYGRTDKQNYGHVLTHRCIKRTKDRQTEGCVDVQTDNKPDRFIDRQMDG